MVNITIDNQKISVPSGTTIMEAAAKLGTPIPKLCYLKDINEIAALKLKGKIVWSHPVITL